MLPETYIVRVYRRSSAARGGELVGHVETPEGKRCASFRSALELSAILERPRDYLEDSESDLGAPESPKRRPQE
jgi:hypothetical protein